MISRRLTTSSIICTIILGTISTAFAARIESDPSKQYSLTKNRGPWMISVATFHTTDPNGQTKSGKTQEEAAHELVLELRNMGMPAYVYIHDPGAERVTVTDRIGREEVRKNLRRVRTVLVLAGNYNDINNKLAQDSLKWVKKINPKCLQDGVKFKPTESRPTPLSGAFLTVNPLLSPDELSRKTTDPLLIKLNHGENYSLAENKGEYTLVVARFSGKQSVVHTKFKFDNLKNDGDLHEAGFAANELATVLRGEYDKDGTFNNIEAFVWHDRHESIVTVGSFASKNDPAIARFQKTFGPRILTYPDGRSNYQPGHFGIDGFGKKRDEVRIWAFEQTPQLMRVPSLK
ncbi:hypothetical protein N8590_03230 [bacterium]|nr:hypothetical protein [Planctomicrobium sp.]MDA7527979.1 hypothetical protein [bacterium]MDB4731835.1 hypothetical protein [bacterium]